jgi:hypothetical protein
MLLTWPSVKHHNTAVNVDVELLLDVFDIQKVKYKLLVCGRLFWGSIRGISSK